MLRIMLDFEMTQVAPWEKPWVGVASLDAVKCFDLLSYPAGVSGCPGHTHTQICAVRFDLVLD